MATLLSLPPEALERIAAHVAADARRGARVRAPRELAALAAASHVARRAVAAVAARDFAALVVPPRAFAAWLSLLSAGGAPTSIAVPRGAHLRDLSALRVRALDLARISGEVAGLRGALCGLSRGLRVLTVGLGHGGVVDAVVAARFRALHALTVSCFAADGAALLRVLSSFEDAGALRELNFSFSVRRKCAAPPFADAAALARAAPRVESVRMFASDAFCSFDSSHLLECIACFPYLRALDISEGYLAAILSSMSPLRWATLRPFLDTARLPQFERLALSLGDIDAAQYSISSLAEIAADAGSRLVRLELSRQFRMFTANDIRGLGLHCKFLAQLRIHIHAKDEDAVEALPSMFANLPLLRILTIRVHDEQSHYTGDTQPCVEPLVQAIETCAAPLEKVSIDLAGAMQSSQIERIMAHAGASLKLFSICEWERLAHNGDHYLSILRCAARHNRELHSLRFRTSLRHEWSAAEQNMLSVALDSLHHELAHLDVGNVRSDLCLESGHDVLVPGATPTCNSRPHIGNGYH